MNRNSKDISSIGLASSVWKLAVMLVLLVFIMDTFILPNLDQDQNTILIELNAEENDSEEEKEEKEESEKDGEEKFFHVQRLLVEPIMVSNIYLSIWNNSSLLSHSWDLITPPPEFV
jgi:lipopolysaccharide export LptBFGC system permease protein LptF